MCFRGHYRPSGELSGNFSGIAKQLRDTSGCFSVFERAVHGLYGVLQDFG